MQEQDVHFKIIRYLSKALNSAERNYSASERECLAIAHALTILKPYLLGTNFTIMTDCRALTTTKEKVNLNSRIMRWLLILQKFTFGIKCVKGYESFSDSLSLFDMSDLENKSFDYNFTKAFVNKRDIELNVFMFLTDS